MEVERNFSDIKKELQDLVTDWLLGLMNEELRMTPKFITCVKGYKNVQLATTGSKERNFEGKIMSSLLDI